MRLWKQLQCRVDHGETRRVVKGRQVVEIVEGPAHLGGHEHRTRETAPSMDDAVNDGVESGRRFERSDVGHDALNCGIVRMPRRIEPAARVNPAVLVVDDAELQAARAGVQDQESHRFDSFLQQVSAGRQPSSAASTMAFPISSRQPCQRGRAGPCQPWRRPTASSEFPACPRRASRCTACARSGGRGSPVARRRRARRGAARE
jgi:hypothetical protein